MWLWNVLDVNYLDALSTGVEQFFQQYRQTSETFEKKVKLRNHLHSAISLAFPNSRLFIVGSSVNGFGLDWSDLDLCFVIPPRELRRRGGAYAVLRDIESLLLHNDFICSCRLIDAKVPILKFRDHESGIECDLNVNNVSGIYNTHLLAMYSRADPRLRLLGVFVIHWAQKMGIHGGSRGRLNTYALLLMVIQYLQCGCSPPVLPNLQAAFPLFFCSRRPVEEVYRKLDLPWRKVRSANKSTLGELFAGFIAYYADFDFAHRVISIRRGRPSRIGRRFCCLPLRKRARPASSFKIFVEGPFLKDNAARSVSGAAIFADIQDAFSRTDEVLRAEEPLSFAWADSRLLPLFFPTASATPLL